MKPLRTEVSWKFLDEYRGKVFDGEWPTLPEMIHITAMRWGDRPCFVDFEGENGSKRSFTYNQVWQNIQTLAQWLMANGVKYGDHVAVSGKNSPEWATVFFAIQLAGGVSIPLDFALHEPEMENLLNTAKPKIFFVDEDKYEYFSKHKNGAKIYSLSPKYEKTYVGNLVSTKKAMDFPKVSDKDTAAILFTSGTTGIPKGVMLSHQNLCCDSFIAQQNLFLYETDVFYNLLPIQHAYTMQAALIVPLSCGASIVFGKSMAVTRLMKELKEGEITVMLGVPLLYNKLYTGIMKGVAAKGKAVEVIIKGFMNFCYAVKKITGKNIGHTVMKSILEAANLSTMRVAICGGGPLAASIFKGYNALGIDFIQGYGLTETSPIIALNPLEHFKIESVGKDFAPYEEIKILNPNAEGIGEICVKGPMVMQGYYKMPEETAKVFTEDGFFKTGDLGWLDEEHYLMLSGRAKNMIVTEGGKNVYPEEIEDQFQLYYDVEQIMVRGYIANEATKSEMIEAVVYPSDDLIKRLNVSRTDTNGKDMIYAAIKEICDKVNKNLQPYARISKITIIDEPLEMTTTRKIKRNIKSAEVEKVVEEVKETAKKVGKKVAAEAKKVEEKAKPAVKKAAAKTKETAKKAAEKAKPAVKKAAAKTKEAVKKAEAKAKPAVEKAAKKVSDGAKKTAAKTKTAVKSAAGKAKEKADTAMKERGKKAAERLSEKKKSKK